MRDWTKHEEELRDAGGRLVFVTTESAEIVRTEVAQRGFGGSWVVVDPQLWADWGVGNTKRPELPWPGTVVVDPDGTVQSLHLFEQYMNRRAPNRTIEAMTSELAPPAAPSVKPEAVDFDNAIQIAFDPTPTGGTLTVDIADGFHIYGTRERQAVGLSLTFDDAKGKAKLPAGHKKAAAYGTNWVVDGRFSVPIDLRGNPSIANGTLTYQTCFESLCAAPQTVDWTLAR